MRRVLSQKWTYHLHLERWEDLDGVLMGQAQRGIGHQGERGGEAATSSGPPVELLSFSAIFENKFSGDTCQRWCSCSLPQRHHNKSWSCSRCSRRGAPPPVGWSAPTTPCCNRQSALWDASWCCHLSGPSPPPAWRGLRLSSLHYPAWEEKISIEENKKTEFTPGREIAVARVYVWFQLRLKVVQLLFDFDNFLREVLLVAQCSGGGENLPDKGRHGGKRECRVLCWCQTDWQKAAVDQSRMYF